jgi:hypothetical protein
MATTMQDGEQVNTIILDGHKSCDQLMIQMLWSMP